VLHVNGTTATVAANVIGCVIVTATDPEQFLLSFT